MKLILENWRKYLEEVEEPEVFWGSVAAGVLAIAQSTGRLLIGLRSPRVYEPGTWGVIGGKLDVGESDNLEVAAKREFEEETGATFEGTLVPVYKFESSGGDFTYQNYIGIVADEFEPTTDWETERFEWMTLEEIIDIEPKHFGLEALLADPESIKKIKEIIGEQDETPT